jgi:hypothetical protein
VRTYTQVGPLGLRAVVHLRQSAFGPVEWPVSYQRAETITVTKLPADDYGSQGTGNDPSWARTSLRDLTRPGPRATAIQRVRAAVEQISVRGWLTS